MVIAARRRLNLRSGFNPRQAPTCPVEVNWSHPLANGLRAFFLLGDGTARNLAGGPIAGTLTGSRDFVSSPRGPMLSTGGNSHVNLGNTFNPTTTLSYVAWIRPASFIPTYTSVIQRSASDFSSFAMLLIKKGSGGATGGLTVNVLSSGGNQVYYDSDAPTLVPGGDYCLAMTYDSVTGISGYVNGGLDSSSSTNAAPIVAGSASTCIGDSPDGGRAFVGLMGPASIYGRTLSASEVQWLNAEPFSMLRPIVRRMYYASAASGGTGGGTTSAKPPRITFIF